MAENMNITQRLGNISPGKTGAEDEVLSLLYNELRALARCFMSHEKEGHTLQTTALVHEAYLKMGGDKAIGFQNKSHFMRLAARTMRRVLIDHARLKKGIKKSGGRSREPLDCVEPAQADREMDLVALDDALKRLNEADPRLVQVVELRYFGGYTIEDTAQALGVSPGTVKNHWKIAKMWLRGEISD
ncbi:MAG: sigma-70 family RNA polymerase sigma factor [Planctomycetota bacterium]